MRNDCNSELEFEEEVTMEKNMENKMKSYLEYRKMPEKAKKM